ncbi:elongation factor P (EF-P) family protein isoform X2 [Tasmannia lanceolata]|uniref:elongation factor P (EF-P) family protein isoform X2 n=1 Tax=Tasmannia lanceolata TaxID=3420 RepID=UPI0040628143
MHAVRKRLSRTLFTLASSSSSARTTTHKPAIRVTGSSNVSVPRGTFAFPWYAVQQRGASDKVHGTDVRSGSVIKRKGRIFQVIEAKHTQHGRGGATIQVELRDVDTGNKITERFRTDEPIERVFVEQKTYTYLYQEDESVTIMEPKTFEQIDVHKELFGNGVSYLQDNMTVSLQMYDGKPMSASVPQRVTCTVAEAQSSLKGLHATPRYKRVVLDNGLTVQFSYLFSECPRHHHLSKQVTG